jgi:hypothetical protein
MLQAMVKVESTNKTLVKLIKKKISLDDGVHTTSSGPNVS